MKSVVKDSPVLKLIYHTEVFGPIELEYDKPVIRVGHSEDNDLVLRHPSIEAHHCLLLFLDEKVLCLPPSESIPSPAELRHLSGPEHGLGDSIRIGDLQFSLAHSGKTVTVPGVHSNGSMSGSPNGEAAGAGDGEQERYYCAHCRTFIPETEVKRVGLVGHAKISLCSRCSRPLESASGVGSSRD